ncbi:MAG TPA: ABC transporter ATP-binding protein [Trebonia sp.]|nr:ABC transporter ATP-binding protein [Trebonia sp.]
MSELAGGGGPAPPMAASPQNRALVLQGEGLQVKYSRHAIAIEDVHLSVPEGALVALLGANGAGKTSTLRALSGFMPSEQGALTAGRVLLDGKPLRGSDPRRIARQGIVLVPERDKVFATLTVEENLTVVQTRRGGDRRGMRELAFEVFPALAKLGRRPAGLLSGGERQMLAIARALVADPRVLLVDELSLGLSPALAARILETLPRIRDLRGLSVLLVEQNARAALEVADYAYILQTGRVVLEGERRLLLDNEAVQAKYLGLTGETSYGKSAGHRGEGGLHG